jgi:hypothetical protein
MNKKPSRKRPQSPKPHKYESAGFIHTLREHSRSSIAEPHRNRSKYRRADFRNQIQKGSWE